VIGSPNFTGAAFSANVEVAVYFDSTSPAFGGNYKLLRALIDEHWRKGKRLTHPEVDSYREVWNRKKHLLGQLAGTYEATPGKKAGKPLFEIEILMLTWPEFVRKVMSEKAPAFNSRTATLRAARTYFHDSKHFADMRTEFRRQIAGLVGIAHGVDWGYFGSMRGAGWFFTAVDRNDESLSAGLDAIPSEGLVTRDDYWRFRRCRTAFRDHGEHHSEAMANTVPR
jgi:hypothetical protein